MRDLIKQILVEETQTYEYQIRYIDGPVFYKRKNGGDWVFINVEEFAENAHNSKIIKWNNEKSH